MPPSLTPSQPQNSIRGWLPRSQRRQVTTAVKRVAKAPLPVVQAQLANNTPDPPSAVENCAKGATTVVAASGVATLLLCGLDPDRWRRVRYLFGHGCGNGTQSCCPWMYRYDGRRTRLSRRC